MVPKELTSFALTCAFVPPKPKQLTLTRFFTLDGQACATRETYHRIGLIVG